MRQSVLYAEEAVVFSLRALAILTPSAIKHAVAIDLQRDKTPSALNISKYLRMVDILGKFDFTVCSILPHLISY